MDDAFPRRAAKPDLIQPRLQGGGVVDADERFELIGGEIVPRNAKFNARIARLFAEPRPDGSWAASSEHGDADTLTSRFQPGLALNLTDLDL